jgi:2,5-diketo-D-gluconate reductase A
MSTPGGGMREDGRMATAPTVRIDDATTMPAIGLGTWPMNDAEAETAVREALRLGYRLVDTAAKYGNEIGVGRGIATGDVPRDQVVVQTKLRGNDQGYEPTLSAFEESRQRLGVDYVDLYLIHWPLPRLDRYVDSWRAMVKLRADGVVRSIGVSNFTAEQIDRLVDETGVGPAVNQIELHPFYPQPEMRAADAERGVLTQSWSPLGRGRGIFEAQPVADAAARLDRSPGQVVLRWHVQLGAVPIPKSASPERQQDNLDVFDFTLTDEEMTAVSSLARGRFGGDPMTHEEF